MGLLPGEVGDVTELATFAIDYTFWLNLLSIAIAGTLFTLARRGESAHARN